MEENRASITSVVTAYSRAYHAMHDDPKIFDDFLAARLFTKEEMEYLEYNLAESLKFMDPDQAASCPDQARALSAAMRYNAPTTLSRSRYTEDVVEKLVDRGVRQYVILGAGMDTFAFRRPDISGKIKVFEIDHPASQTQKKERLARAGLAPSPQHFFIPVDFNITSLDEALGPGLFNRHEPTVFSWLGVTFYLTYDKVMDTFRSIARIAPGGSVVVFDFLGDEAFDSQKASEQSKKVQQIVRNAGEPMKMAFRSAALGAELDKAGLALKEMLSPDEIEARYFAGRTDGYHASPHYYFASAEVKA